MMLVELVYNRDCPNVRGARRALLKGFGLVGLQPSWTEWDRESPDSPVHVRGYGSPTILVEGRDIVGLAPGTVELRCRLYHSGSGSLQGVPTGEQVAAALRADGGQPPFAKHSPSGWRSFPPVRGTP